ncbi:hypothetical protein [Cohnella yongneupensis]|uniref:DUF3221 domain-containing protein n=1 Tax=Cohnella yongneupensis TaxID=425006 RepID=A0ABW0R6F5_9BACL
MRRSILPRLACGCLVLVSLQGCLGAQGNDLPADEAFALSASALSGSESYGLSGEVSVVDSKGFVANRMSYEGQVTGHNNVKVQWTNGNAKSTSTRQVETSSYEPLDLLQSIKGKTSAIAYKPLSNRPDEVQFTIKLDDDVAKRRIADHLRKELTDLGQEKVLLQRKPDQSAKVLTQAKATLEDVLGSLKVTTNCQWTANRRTWFPTQLQENTLLQYKWKGKTYEEKRVSVTNFRAASGNGTIK